MAGSKTPPRVLCSSISVAPGAVLPPGIQLPCGTWGTGHRGQLKIFGSSFKGCKGSINVHLTPLVPGEQRGGPECVRLMAQGCHSCIRVSPGAGEILLSRGFWCEFGRMTGQSVPLWGMAYQLRIHALFLLLISETSASAMQSKRRKSK